jgi:hypothetical protein
MGRLDKKALKFLKTRQFVDLDAGDIAIALRCDDDIAQESLKSLKEQKLIESYFLDGKTYWRLNSEGNYEKSINSEPEIKSEVLKTSIDLEEVSFDMTAYIHINKDEVKGKKGLIELDTSMKIDTLQKSEPEEFNIELLPKKSSDTKNQAASESSKKTKELEKSDSEEISFELAPQASDKVKQQPAVSSPIEKHEVAKKTESVEFSVEPLPQKPIIKAEKPKTVEPAPVREIKEKPEPTEFNIDIIESTDLSKPDNDEELVDDSTRSWTPTDELLKHEEEDSDSANDDYKETALSPTPLKRKEPSKIWILLAVAISVAISTGITVFIAMNVNKTAMAGLQSLETTIAENSSRQDQRIDMLNKKLNELLEKSDFAQKNKAPGIKNRPGSRPKE